MYCSRFCFPAPVSVKVPVVKEQQQQKNNEEQNRAIIVEEFAASSICHRSRPPFDQWLTKYMPLILIVSIIILTAGLVGDRMGMHTGEHRNTWKIIYLPNILSIYYNYIRIPGCFMEVCDGTG